MATGFDNAGGTAATFGTTGAVTFTIGSANARLLVAIPIGYDGDSSYVIGVRDGNGRVFTRLGGLNDGGASGHAMEAEIFYLLDPTSGGNTITAQWLASAQRIIMCMSFFDVRPGLPISGFQGQYVENGNTNSVNVTSDVNSLICGGVDEYLAETATELGSQTNRVNLAVGTKASTLAGGASPTAFGYSFTGASVADSIMVACSVNFGAVPPPFFRKNLLYKMGRPRPFAPGVRR